ncbi:glycosyl transferase family protein [Gloeobacter kilaueensis JS1]|uniref:Glycosyl transferase family protein n=1 Tax=Gloeobacter kilaueensis (strain ATCC BAA-2537 / CCAP 1431/1 / ULC 316 / JS1) TaxID=1183438 RepID=U5QHT9_GLOK1|nr:glycosyl transferase family protein [Gloeobacter kilaueensis JS1]
MTLTSLIAQSFKDFDLIVSDQTEEGDPLAAAEVQTALAVLRIHGHRIAAHKHLPRRGMAEHRQFLLDQAQAPYVLFLDDDLILESWLVGALVRTLKEEDCGFVGSAVIGLSYLADVRPHEQQIRFWDGPVQPESVRPDTPEWERYRLHNAANLYHLQRRLGLGPADRRRYRVAWVGGCVLYDTARLRSVGGFQFWRSLPPVHCGEDALAQLRVMARYGGCGLIPSGVYHQELPTTIEDRTANAPRLLEVPEAG